MINPDFIETFSKYATISTNKCLWEKNHLATNLFFVVNGKVNILDELNNKLIDE